MKNIFSFIGEITRTEFWLTILGYALIVAGYFCLVVFADVDQDNLLFLCFNFAFLFLMKYLILAASAKRITDAGYPWYLVFLDFFPLFGPIAVIILACLPSSEIQLSK